jgi:hypothetical protein
MDYPVWPSRRSLDLLRASIIQYSQTHPDEKVIENLRKDNNWNGTWKGVPILFKEGPTIDHESQILQVINQVRINFPNFNFGLLKVACNNQPWITPPCETVGTEVLITELTPGPTVEEYIQSGASFLSLLNLFVQTMFALDFVRSEYNFVHGNLTARNIICRQLPGVRTMVYGNGVVVEDDQIPVIFNFANSTCYGPNRNLIGEPQDARKDIYSALVTMLRAYPEELQILLNWYGVDFNVETEDLNWWIAEMTPRLIFHTTFELAWFCHSSFGWGTSGIAPVLEPEDIPGFSPIPLAQIQPGLQDLVRQAKNRQEVFRREQRKKR